MHRQYAFWSSLCFLVVGMGFLYLAQHSTPRDTLATLLIGIGTTLLASGLFALAWADSHCARCGDAFASAGTHHQAERFGVSSYCNHCTETA